MAKVIRTLELAQYKKNNGIVTLAVYTGKTSGKKYACNKDTGDYIGHLSEDFDPKKPVIVHTMQDDDTQDTWDFICNGEPREAEFTM